MHETTLAFLRHGGRLRYDELDGEGEFAGRLRVVLCAINEKQLIARSEGDRDQKVCALLDLENS